MMDQPSNSSAQASVLGASSTQAALLDFNAAELDAHLGASKQPLLLDLWAPWCQPCRQQHPILVRFAGYARGRLDVAKLDVDQNKEISERLKLRGIPTLILFKDGKELSRKSGVQTIEQLNAWMLENGIDIGMTLGASGEDPPPFDGAFYGSAGLKDFLLHRVLAAAKDGRIEGRSRLPFWIEGRGTAGSAVVEHADSEVFGRVTNLPPALGVFMNFADCSNPALLQDLFDAIAPGADLRLSPMVLMSRWLGDTAWDWPQMLGEPVDAIRREWLALTKRSMEGNAVAPEVWAELKERIDANKTTDPYQATGRHFLDMLRLLSPATNAIPGGQWSAALCLLGTYLVTVQRWVDAGWTEHDIAMDSLRLQRFKAICADPSGLTKEEMEKVHAQYRSQFGAEEDAFEPKQTSFRALSPDLVAPRYHQLQAHLLASIRQPKGV